MKEVNLQQLQAEAEEAELDVVLSTQGNEVFLVCTGGHKREVEQVYSEEEVQVIEESKQRRIKEIAVRAEQEINNILAEQLETRFETIDCQGGELIPVKNNKKVLDLIDKHKPVPTPTSDLTDRLKDAINKSNDMEELKAKLLAALS